MAFVKIWLGLPVLVAMLHVGGPASAQEEDTTEVPEDVEDPTPGSPEAVEAARQYFEEALESYKDGNYEEAVVSLELALELDPLGKDLVYNLGLVHEKRGDLEQALVYFRRYEQMEVNPLEKQRAQATIRRLEGALQEGEGQAPQVAAADEKQVAPELVDVPLVVDRAGGRLDGWVYGAGGVAVASGLVGTFFGFRAILGHPGSRPRTTREDSIDDLHRAADDARSDARIADVAFTISLVSAGVAVLLYFARPAQPRALRAQGQSLTLQF